MPTIQKSFLPGCRVWCPQYGFGTVIHPFALGVAGPVFVEFDRATGDNRRIHVFLMDGRATHDDLFPSLYHCGDTICIRDEQDPQMRPKLMCKAACEFEKHERVLVRCSVTQPWVATIFSHVEKDEGLGGFHDINGCSWHYCAPFDWNEWAVGKCTDEDGYELTSQVPD